MLKLLDSYLDIQTCWISFPVLKCNAYLPGSTMYLPPAERKISFSGCFIFRCSAEKLPSITTLLVYNHLTSVNHKDTNKYTSHIPLWILVPIFRKVDTRLRTCRAEYCKTSRLNLSFLFMTHSSINTSY